MKTKKMGHGHHGANHPVKNLEDGTVLITSQNHGFCIDEVALPDTVRVTHRSLFDDTIQGINWWIDPLLGFRDTRKQALARMMLVPCLIISLS